MALPVELQQSFSEAMDIFTGGEQVSDVTRDYLAGLAGRLVAAYTVMAKMGLEPYPIINREGTRIRGHLPDSIDAPGADPLVRQINTPYVALLGNKLLEGNAYEETVSEMRDRITKASLEEIRENRPDRFIASTGELAVAAKQGRFTALGASCIVAGREIRVASERTPGFLRTDTIDVSGRATFLVENLGAPAFQSRDSAPTNATRFTGSETRIVGTMQVLPIAAYQRAVPAFGTLHFAAQ